MSTDREMHKEDVERIHNGVLLSQNNAIYSNTNEPAGTVKKSKCSIKNKGLYTKELD